ncbi:MAG: hypothetical protein ACHQRM_12285 [Bacteroidia bacterium]
MKVTSRIYSPLFLCFTFLFLFQCLPAWSLQFHTHHTGSDSLKKELPSKDPFIRLETGIGLLNSYYTSEVVTGGSGGFNNVDDYHGTGYSIPAGISAGYRYHTFSAGLGIAVQYFHVPMLTRSVYALDSTNATGSAVKHQLKGYGKNYIIPLFLEYRFLKKGNAAYSIRLAYGAFFHDRTAYDGTYAPSSTPLAFGHSFSFGITPSWTKGPWNFFLHPSLLLTQIRYHGSSNEELTDLSFNFGIGVDYQIH